MLRFRQQVLLVALLQVSLQTSFRHDTLLAETTQVTGRTLIVHQLVGPVQKPRNLRCDLLAFARCRDEVHVVFLHERRVAAELFGANLAQKLTRVTLHVLAQRESSLVKLEAVLQC